ncbi:RNA polymerase sigma factor [Sphingobacterium thalpophilum]|uniref:RNA polymerase sigma factor n=1 Tax=Sphingobacterium thalpophilum TaxID=259 RepID=A0A4U9VES1_9SPHI|nr:sigma-70 family RNA polymerase sigma factor [Sphingobacterium thalpophilum]VTR43809.1 RNA polymerase sigma factor [Sphingobacterium thalpophilum]
MSKDQDILEIQLWEALRSGEQAALQKLYMSYYKSLLQYGLRYTDDRDSLKDSINNTFLYFWEKRDSISSASHVGNYIFKSYQRQLVKDLSSSNKFETLLENNDNAEAVDIEEFQFIIRQEENTRISILKNAILQLPKRQRELILLRYYEGLSYDEISRQTNLTKRAVYNQIHTAINALKKDTKLKNLKQILPLLIFF